MAPYLNKEDYDEPTCLLCGEPEKKSPRQIPVGRVLEKLDEFTGTKDYDRALRHLDYWLEEARAGRDEGGVLTLLNEKMGVLRKTERHAEAEQTAEEALRLAEKMQLSDAAAGTTFLNAATVKNAAGKPNEALPLYERAEKIYKEVLPASDARLAGLYNNMAVALARLGRFARAKECYASAIGILETLEDTFLDRAVSFVNLADLIEAEKGSEEGEREIADALGKAKELLDDPRVKQDAYAAFVYEKCAPAFSWHGWFAYADELNERSVKLYEGT